MVWVVTTARTARIATARLAALALTFTTTAVLTATLGPRLAAAAQQTVAVPVKCTMAGSRLVVSPAPLTTYRVSGGVDILRIPVCRPAGRGPGSLGCAAVDVYRFDMTCDGRRVSWADVSAQLAQRSANEERLIARTVRVGDQNARCRTIFGSSGVRGGLIQPLAVACRLGRQGLVQQILLPPGFAPLLERDPRGVATAATAAHADDGKVYKTAAGKAGRTAGLVTSSPLPDLTPGAARDAALEGTRTLAWVADVRMADREEANVLSSLNAQMLGLAATLLLLAGVVVWRNRSGFAVAGGRRAAADRGGDGNAAWTAWSRTVEGANGMVRSGLQAMKWAAGTASRRSRPQSRSDDGGTASGFTDRPKLDANADNAAQAVDAMLSATSRKVALLRTAGPLREVLTQELAALRQRLSGVVASAADGGAGSAARAAAGFRNLMRDIERVSRIADGAMLSMDGARAVARVPKTKSEAYELLGLNPDVNDATLKKVADGLRMSWHPDHARDEDDRAARETRIKSINIAIDLIQGKRTTAA